MSSINSVLLNIVVSNTRHGDGKEETKTKMKNRVEIEQVHKIGTVKEKLPRKVILELLLEFLEESWSNSPNYNSVRAVLEIIFRNVQKQDQARRRLCLYRKQRNCIKIK